MLIIYIQTFECITLLLAAIYQIRMATNDDEGWTFKISFFTTTTEWC